jgi:hypothetical protein
MFAIRSSWLLAIAFLVSVCIGNPVPCRAQQQPVAPSEVVDIPVRPLPFILHGFLRRPEGTGRFPAVVLLPVCNPYVRPLDESWGARLSSWGYVTLTIDGFAPRGFTQCGKAVKDYPDLAFDAYRGLSFLAQKRFVDPRRVAVVGFGPEPGKHFPLSNAARSNTPPNTSFARRLRSIRSAAASRGL